MSKKLIGVFAAILALTLVLVYFPVHGEGEIYDTVLRLHVLANSDSEEDQSLKLKVRDAIIKESREMLEGCETRENAAATVEKNRDRLLYVAKQVIDQEGYDYPVRVQLGMEEYPERTYDGCAFPSGEYLSLRVVIGEGEGKNWWCVLFPPLCLSAASADKSANEDAFVAVGLNKDQYSIITQTDKTTYRVRFKLLEVFKSVFG